jgi:hypothetical protein
MKYDLNTSSRVSDIPILLVIWRRPHTLKKLIDALRPSAPKNLFVACDGPRLNIPGEAEKVAATRSLISSDIDWPCQLQTLFSEVNRGCSVGPIRAITWFFEQVEEGIVLEDDCIPHVDFFSYCSSLLEYYRHDTRVWCISGNNFQDGKWRGDGTYYFSRYTHCWGWASWRRCWLHFDPHLKSWPALRDSSQLDTIFEDVLERRYWSIIWERTYQHSASVTWWDYQWTYACLTNGGLTIIPNQNLVSNIGFGDDSSHFTEYADVRNADQGLDTLLHPQFIVRDSHADIYTFRNHYLAASRRVAGLLLPRLKAQVLHTWKKIKRSYSHD